ncbi:MAG: hypothetical protein NTY14_07310 [Candidatus Omnitrophica bacterium]|nr:hypothetical protein [Candidatus Omnitrophota bacterium]
MRKSKILVLISVFILMNSLVFTQEPKKPDELALEIVASQDNQQAFSLLKGANEAFSKEGKFNEFSDFLKNLSLKKKSLEPVLRYFSSLSRYQQLKYLEEKQAWDEYFNKGNDYRQDLTSGLDEVIKSATAKDPLSVYARLLLWQFHQDQQDVFAQDSLADLTSSAKPYAEATKDAVVLKVVADKLQAYEQKSKAREIYKLYIDNVVNVNSKENELKAMAAGFFKDGNLELAETVYDAYIEKIVKSRPKDDLIPELVNLAREFVYKDGSLNDPGYAEKIFSRIESLSSKSAFDEQLSYLRAYNLERAREFDKAKAVYLDFLSRFPNSPYYDKVNFKLGIISAYVLRDVKEAREFFQKLAGKETVNSEVISSLYQLGLLAQWEEDLERAKANYLKLKEKAGDEFKSSLGLAEERLKEIAENKLLDNNIRSFLDVSLKDEYSTFNMSKLELKSSAYNLKKGQEFTMTATAYPPESGCLQVILEYGWALDLGKAAPTFEDSNFTSAYSESGVKVIGLVVRTSAGIIDRSIDLIDVE